MGLSINGCVNFSILKRIRVIFPQNILLHFAHSISRQSVEKENSFGDFVVGDFVFEKLDKHRLGELFPAEGSNYHGGDRLA